TERQRRRNLTINDNALQHILSKVFAPLTDPSMAKDGDLLQYSDGHTRKCYQIVTGWLADLLKNTKRLGLMSGACPNCEAPIREFGDYLPDGVRRATRDFSKYRDAHSRTTSGNTNNGIRSAYLLGAARI